MNPTQEMPEYILPELKPLEGDIAYDPNASYSADIEPPEYDGSELTDKFTNQEDNQPPEIDWRKHRPAFFGLNQLERKPKAEQTRKQSPGLRLEENPHCRKGNLVTRLVPDDRVGSEIEHVYEDYAKERESPYHVDGLNTTPRIDRGCTVPTISHAISFRTRFLQAARR